MCQMLRLVVLIAGLFFTINGFWGHARTTKTTYNVYAKGSIAMSPIDMYIIYAIESSHNELAENKKSGAKGLGQVTKAALDDYNTYNNTNIKEKDLFNRVINERVSDWYMNIHIPAMLSEKQIPDTVENRLIGYNAGVGNLGKILIGEKVIPQETSDYIIKYKMGGDVKAGQIKLKELGFDPGPIDGLLGPKTRNAFNTFQESAVSAPPVVRQSGIQSLKRK